MTSGLIVGLPTVPDATSEPLPPIVPPLEIVMSREAVVRAVTRLSVRRAELDFVDLVREEAERLGEAIARRVLRERVELGAVAVRAAAVGTNAGRERELFVEGDDLLVDVVRLIAELL